MQNFTSNTRYQLICTCLYSRLREHVTQSVLRLLFLLIPVVSQDLSRYFFTFVHIYVTRANIFIYLSSRRFLENRHEEAPRTAFFPPFITPRPQKTPKQLFAARNVHIHDLSHRLHGLSSTIFRRGFGELSNTMLKTASSWKWRRYRDGMHVRLRGDFLRELG